MVLVLNGDSYCSCNLADFTAKKRTNGAYAGIALAHVENVARFGAVLTDEKSFVASFMEKGEQTGPGWINAGLYLLPTELMFEISPARQVSLEHDVIPALIKKGLYGYHCAGPFIDIGVPEEFQRSQLFFLEKTRGKP
jgi:D-glycero-alpha-D-manno-heptose 1-phosphate guanylyltransferase